MPGKVKVKILAGRNLPVMDRSSDTTDAYVEIKLGSTTYKTDVCRKSLHPKWNSEWYRFEVDDTELQDEPLQIRLMDHDTYSANDAIGRVYVDLNPLLLPATSHLMKYGWKSDSSSTSDNMANSILSGWFPVYDTMHGIRGEVNIIVKVELFTDFNRFRQSSCGVQFFCSPSVPHGYYSQVVNGFVEELIVNDDPEYQWIDKIRTPRASNEARQTLFFKLSRELQRKIGVKALDLGGNAVIGYRQCFDLEGESGIVARGIGTAVTLVKVVDILHSKIPEEITVEGGSPLAAEHSQEQLNQPIDLSSLKISSPAKTSSATGICRRSSDSDLSVTPKGSSLAGSDRSVAMPASGFLKGSNPLKGTILLDNFEMLEYPFLTMSKYPPRFIIHLGGAVNARSVKLLERISNLEEPETRDMWWSELRMEIRSHARALNCNAVLGYSESTSICEDVCILSASGTAAVIGFHCFEEISDNLHAFHVAQKSHLAGNKDAMTTSLDRNEFEKVKSSEESQKPESPEQEIQQPFLNTCSICHIPYNTNNVPVRATTLKCAECRAGRVPDMVLATIDIPDGLHIIGRGSFIQSFVCRPLKDSKGESNAKEISDGLPFLDYELHRLLINKLKVKGMNAIFGLTISVSVGEKMLIGIITGTACFLAALPPPTIPKLVSYRSAEQKKLNELQKELNERVKKNKELYNLKDVEEVLVNGKVLSDDEDEDHTRAPLDFTYGKKECCILEVDDPEDQEVLQMLMEKQTPDGFYIVNTEFVPGLEDLEIVKNLQMFTQVFRAKLQPAKLDKHIQNILQSIYFKLRRMIPCALCKMQFQVELPEQDEIQLCVLGITMGLGDSQKFKTKLKTPCFKKHNDDLIFEMDDNSGECSSTHQPLNKTPSCFSLLKKPSSSKNMLFIKERHLPYIERHGIDITPLSYVPGAKIEKYLGNLNFFFIRESTSLREDGGISSFIHGFITEVLAIIRAHVANLGGNAMVAYFMTKCILNYSVHKNQGQCLINVGGDVVNVTYFKEDI